MQKLFSLYFRTSLTFYDCCFPGKYPNVVLHFEVNFQSVTQSLCNKLIYIFARLNVTANQYEVYSNLNDTLFLFP